MAADLITRIVLDDNKFNDTLKKVRKELDVSGSVASGFTNALKGVAGGLGLVMGAQEAFNKLMAGSQAFGDNMALSLNSVSDSVDELFYSLGTGDFSSFNNGLDNIIAKSKAATAALDQLGNTRISYGYFDSYYNDQMSGAMLNAKNKQLGKEDREKGFADWDAILKQKEEAAKSLSDTAIDAALKTAKKGTLLRDIGLGDIERIVKLDVLPVVKRDSVKGQLAEEYRRYEDELKKIEANRRFRISGTNDRSQIEMINESAQRKKQNLADQYKESILFNKLLQKDSDEELQNLVNIAAEARNTTKAIKDQRREYNESIVEFKNSLKVGGGGGTDKANPSIPENSIANIEKQLSEAKSSLRLAVDPKSRAELYNEITALENEKHVIEFQYKHPNEPGKVEEQGIPNFAALAKMPSTKLTSPANSVSAVDKKDVKNNRDFASSLMTISNVMGSITNLTNDGAAAWVAWGANLLSSVAAAIPAITTLIGLKSTEAVTNGVASATQTPIVGWLLAGAAAAAVIGALMSIPKFATGGIVPGSSTFGDNMLARVNSGEMILNTSQQSNLFSLLNGGGSVSRQRVELKVKGKDLVAVLGNYNNQRNKIL